MTPTYQYIPSPDYINALDFDHMATYSLQRGASYDVAIKTMRPEYDRLRARNEQRNDLQSEGKQRLKGLQHIFGFTQYLLDRDGQFHFSAIKTNLFQSGNPIIDRFKTIMQTEPVNVPAWMCAPIYRDALVFYDATGHIVSTLNVCLSCEYMEIVPFNHINADEATYRALKEFFIEVGHEIEPD